MDFLADIRAVKPGIGCVHVVAGKTFNANVLGKYGKGISAAGT